jgi:hypothetical protein
VVSFRCSPFSDASTTKVRNSISLSELPTVRLFRTRSSAFRISAGAGPVLTLRVSGGAAVEGCAGLDRFLATLKWMRPKPRRSNKSWLLACYIPAGYACGMTPGRRWSVFLMPRDSATDVRLIAEGRRYYSSQTAPAAPATDARYRASQPRIRASIVARKIATAILRHIMFDFNPCRAGAFRSRLQNILNLSQICVILPPFSL